MSLQHSRSCPTIPAIFRTTNYVPGSLYFSRLILEGNFSAASTWLTNKTRQGLFKFTYIDSKTGKPVWEVLSEKHPPAREPPSSAFLQYPHNPLGHVDIGSEVVERVATRIQGSAGPTGADSAAWQSWLLRFGPASSNLREQFAALNGLLANRIRIGKLFATTLAQELQLFFETSSFPTKSSVSPSVSGTFTVFERFQCFQTFILQKVPNIKKNK